MDLRVENNITKIVMGSLIALTAIALSYGIFSYYKNSLSQKAHEVFVQRYNEFEALYPAFDNDQATQLSQQLTQDAAAYKWSPYGGFFLALQAEVLQYSDKKQEALATMEKAVSSLTSVDPVLYYSYATKLALMQLDSVEPAMQTKGRQSLEKLAALAKNPMRDMALFYLGYQAFLDNDNQGVQLAWSKLFDMQQNPTSLWGMRALNLRNYTA